MAWLPDSDVRCQSVMGARRSARPRYQESALARLAPQGLEGGPARVDGLLLVRVRLDVEILAADGAEAGAVWPAEDLVGHREGDLVSRPGRDVELAVRQVLRAELLVRARIARLVFLRVDLDRDGRVARLFVDTIAATFNHTLFAQVIPRVAVLSMLGAALFLAGEYVLRTRLHRAAVRLRTCDEPISTIAFDAGFGDLSTFNRRFRRLMGCSPGAYRAARIHC